MTLTKPTKEQRLKLLLSKGYFPVELPPPFHTLDFAKYRKSLESHWPAADLEKFSSVGEGFSIPRHGKSRRRLTIVNPINQFKLSKLITDNWTETRKFLSQSKITEFQPIFDLSGDRCFFDIDFDSIERRTTEILALYNSAIKSDISRYYPTIYTHSAPWALYGKTFCKQNRFTASFKNSFGNLLDKYIRQCQDDQSIGIPIGPETSRVVGEIIGTAIEQFLQRNISNFDDRSLRFVDDIVVGYQSHESSDWVLSELQRAFSHFELEINIDKTKIYGINEQLTPEWIIPIRAIQQRGIFVTISELEEYFKTANFLAQSNPRDGVIKYALKRSRIFRFSKDSWQYYQNWIIRITRKNYDCLPILSQILIEKKFEGYDLNNETVSRFIEESISSNIDIHNSFEISWALFLAKGLSIKLKIDIEDKVIHMNSSSCALLLFDLNSRNLLKNPLSKANWSSIYESGGLSDERWLLVYEATLKGWLSSTPCFVNAHPFFGPMLRKKISFYDEKTNVTKTKKELILSKIRKIRSRIIFSKIHDYF